MTLWLSIPLAILLVPSIIIAVVAWIAMLHQFITGYMRYHA